MIQQQRGCDMNGKLSAGNALLPTLGDEIHHGKEQEKLMRCGEYGGE
jgi:hypothetical protein